MNCFAIIIISLLFNLNIKELQQKFYKSYLIHTDNVSNCKYKYSKIKYWISRQNQISQRKCKYQDEHMKARKSSCEATIQRDQT